MRDNRILLMLIGYGLAIVVAAFAGSVVTPTDVLADGGGGTEPNPPTGDTLPDILGGSGAAPEMPGGLTPEEQMAWQAWFLLTYVI